MARSWSPNWPYSVPKTEVASLLSLSLSELRSAQANAPQNEELLLLTGIVAHLAYNVDVDETYDIAVKSFEQASKLAPGDYRAEWFLASHRCQSNEIETGMEQLLSLERQLPWQQLPAAFWDDYINCSTIALMPAHTLRAIDHAVNLGENSSAYSSTIDIARSRYKSTDVGTTYPARDAWQAIQEGKEVQFASQLCGIGFSAHGDWHMDIRDVANGVCLSLIETGPYPSKSGQATPTILVLSRSPKPQEGLDEFVQSFLKKFLSARPITAPSCPIDKCVAFEVVTDSMYESEGGGHFLIVGFAEQPPDFPGLIFEKPEAPPKAKSAETVAYSAIEKLHRLPGLRYTVVELDSNVSIFEKAAQDFQCVLKSIQLD